MSPERFILGHKGSRRQHWLAVVFVVLAALSPVGVGIIVTQTTNTKREAVVDTVHRNRVAQLEARRQFCRALNQLHDGDKRDLARAQTQLTENADFLKQRGVRGTHSPLNNFIQRSLPRLRQEKQAAAALARILPPVICRQYPSYHR